jgi:transcriptional antiterminator NusG
MRPLGIKVENLVIDYAEGDSVKVIAGVWRDTVGIVRKMDMNKQIVTINVELFGRETPVEISFEDVQKL